jgi:hypothetical protein
MPKCTIVALDSEHELSFTLEEHDVAEYERLKAAYTEARRHDDANVRQLMAIVEPALPALAAGQVVLINPQPQSLSASRTAAELVGRANGKIVLVEAQPLSESRIVATIESVLREHPNWMWREALRYVSKRDDLATFDAQSMWESWAEVEHRWRELNAFVSTRRADSASS